MDNQIQSMEAKTIEQVLLGGDLSKLNTEQRLNYYMSVCQSTGLNPLTKPFDYISLSGKLVLYARKDATDQLRATRKVSIYKLEREKIDGIYTVTAYARTADGREDSSIGAVNIENLRGDALANGIMKAETKSKRRVTLSICGLGILDETELETIPNVHTIEPLQIPQSIDQPKVRIVTTSDAQQIATSDGKLYGTLDTHTLLTMRKAIEKAMAKADRPEQIEELEYRLDAIDALVQQEEV